MTAVQWLFEQLPTIDKYDPYYADIIKQAKELEKEQIIDFTDSYGTYLLVGGTMSAASYKETFKSE